MTTAAPDIAPPTTDPTEADLVELLSRLPVGLLCALRAGVLAEMDRPDADHAVMGAACNRLAAALSAHRGETPT